MLTKSVEKSESTKSKHALLVGETWSKMEIKGTQKITKSEIKSSNLISSVSTLIANH